MQIIPTILDKDFSQAQYKIKLIKDMSQWIQIDVIDGIYSEGRSFQLELLTKINFDTNKTLWETHLMVKEPQKWIEKNIFAGASRIIGQVEMMDDLNEFVKEIKDSGVEAGLGFDIETKIENIPEDTDVVLLMARKAGFEPQDFDNKVIDKIEDLSNLRQKEGLKFLIGVDGGVNLDNLELIKKAGADIAYCGGAVFNGNVEMNWEQLTNAK
ncbi:MAG: hypothetical protein Q8P53_03540 [Candidatus Shapirobacteria bacterium]|nr:hypothetical protein [Candidatus Shapirobacteria bacterium]